MKPTSLALWAAASVVAMACWAPAQAGILVTAVYSGTVSSGYDLTGIFGVPNANLAGDSFSVTYTVQDGIPAFLEKKPGLYSHVFGGQDYGFFSSPVSASVTINGVTDPIFGFSDGEAERKTLAYCCSDVFHVAQDTFVNFSPFQVYDKYVFSDITSQTDPFSTNSDYHSPLSHAVGPDDVVTGIYNFTVFDFGVNDYVVNTTASLPASRVDVSAVNVIPEPGAWLLLLVGFSGLGCALRARRPCVGARIWP